MRTRVRFPPPPPSSDRTYQSPTRYSSERSASTRRTPRGSHRAAAVPGPRDSRRGRAGRRSDCATPRGPRGLRGIVARAPRTGRAGRLSAEAGVVLLLRGSRGDVVWRTLPVFSQSRAASLPMSRAIARARGNIGCCDARLPSARGRPSGGARAEPARRRRHACPDTAPALAEINDRRMLGVPLGLREDSRRLRRGLSAPTTKHGFLQSPRFRSGTTPALSQLVARPPEDER